jgi:glycosyltransferase involved in cell wall biosynthesis
MASALLSLLTNATLRRAMGAAAVAHASMLSWETSGDGVIARYDAVARRGRVR